jgi:endo-1,4-beta-mannosidase
MMQTVDFSAIRGFNYQPSYGSTSFENWLYFKPEIFELELRRGKQYFPKFNTVRLWLSWDAYVRNPGLNADYFEKALRICDSLDLKVVACLLNRWHNTHVDNGGVYLDNIVPGWGAYRPQFYKEYFDSIVGGHKDDKRILIWDLCNEPFFTARSSRKWVRYRKLNIIG